MHADGVLEPLQAVRVDVELPVEVGAHLTLHLVHLPEGEQDLFEYVSSQIDLAGDRERGQEQAEAGQAAGG